MATICTRLAVLFWASLTLSAAADSSFDISIIETWGYKQTTTKTFNPLICKSKTTAHQVNLQGIKSVNPLNNSPDTYYRFTLGEEIFLSKENLDKRINELTHSNYQNSLESKSCHLMTFFHCENRLYFVHTDALLFANEMENVKNRYLEATCNNKN
jgi:hypothetical protein